MGLFRPELYEEIESGRHCEHATHRGYNDLKLPHKGRQDDDTRSYQEDDDADADPSKDPFFQPGLAHLPEEPLSGHAVGVFGAPVHLVSPEEAVALTRKPDEVDGHAYDQG